MAATAARAASDRSDFRTVTVGGAKLGVTTAVAVVAFLAASRLVPIAAGLRGGGTALIVLTAGVGRALFSPPMGRAGGTQGIAGAPATGPPRPQVGDVVFILPPRPA